MKKMSCFEILVFLMIFGMLATSVVYGQTQSEPTERFAISEIQPSYEAKTKLFAVGRNNRLVVTDRQKRGVPHFEMIGDGYQLIARRGGPYYNLGSGIGGMQVDEIGHVGVGRIGLILYKSVPFVGNLDSVGAEFIFTDEVSLLGTKFKADPNIPLGFKLVKQKGLVYLFGKGTVVTKDGKVHRLGYADTIEIWLARIKSADQLDREGATQALSWLVKTKEEKEKVVPALAKALKDKAMEVRRNAAEALGRVGDPSAISALNSLIEGDKNEWVRSVAKESLAIIKTEKK